MNNRDEVYNTLLQDLGRLGGHGGTAGTINQSGVELIEYQFSMNNIAYIIDGIAYAFVNGTFVPVGVANRIDGQLTLLPFTPSTWPSITVVANSLERIATRNREAGIEFDLTIKQKVKSELMAVEDTLDQAVTALEQLASTSQELNGLLPFDNVFGIPGQYLKVAATGGDIVNTLTDRILGVKELFLKTYYSEKQEQSDAGPHS